MFRLTACLCFKNSSSYLAEWLAFHRIVGVEHFYLYDNESTDDYRRVVQPYLDRGWATLHVWPGKAQQTAIYQHCLTTFRDQARWIAFIDDDEFLWPVVDPDLPTALERYADHAGVAVCWFLFGSSMHVVRPPGLVIENYTWTTVRPTEIHVKCVVDPRRVASPADIGHSFNCIEGFAMVDEHKRPISGPLSYTPSGDFLRINHYLTKSLEELRARRITPRADSGRLTEHPMSLWEYWAVAWNQREDRSVLRFLPAVQAAMREVGPPS